MRKGIFGAKSKALALLPDINRILSNDKWGERGFWKRCLLVAGSAALGLLTVSKTGNPVRRGLF